MLLSGHDDVALLNDIANDAEPTQKSIIMSYSLFYRVNQLGKLINGKLGECLDIKFQERMLNRLASLPMSTSVLEVLPGKLDIK